jgi:hypothetical protein
MLNRNTVEITGQWIQFSDDDEDAEVELEEIDDEVFGAAQASLGL